MVLSYKCILPLPPSQLCFGVLPTNVVLSGSILFLLTTARNLVICSYHIYPSVPLLMDIQALCCHHQQGGGGCVLLCESFCRGCVPRVAELATLYAFFLPICLPNALSNSCTTPVSFPVSPHLCQHLVLSEFFIFANLLNVKWYLIFLLCFSYYL